MSMEPVRTCFSKKTMVEAGRLYAYERQHDPDMPSRPFHFHAMSAEERAWWLEGYLSVEPPKRTYSKLLTFELAIAALCVGYILGVWLLH